MRKKVKMTIAVIGALVLLGTPGANIARSLVSTSTNPSARFVPALVVFVVGCLAWLIAHILIKERSIDVVECPNENCRAHVLRRKGKCSECGTKIEGEFRVICQTTHPEDYM